MVAGSSKLVNQIHSTISSLIRQYGVLPQLSSAPVLQSSFVLIVDLLAFCVPRSPQLQFGGFVSLLPPLHHFPTSSLPMSPPPHTLTSHHCSEILVLIVIVYEALSNMAKPIHGAETFQVGDVWDPAAKFRRRQATSVAVTSLLAKVCV